MSAVADGIGPEGFREALARFASGVAVITAREAPGRHAGCTVTAFCALSLDPPLVLTCLRKGSRTGRAVAGASTHAVHILGADQAALARRFSGAGDRFRGIVVRADRLGPPVLEGSLAVLVCARHDVLTGGDHDIVVGRVVDTALSEGSPLIASHQGLTSLPAPTHAPPP